MWFLKSRVGGYGGESAKDVCFEGKFGANAEVTARYLFGIQGFGCSHVWGDPELHLLGNPPRAPGQSAAPVPGSRPPPTGLCERHLQQVSISEEF
ncbi:uncharacterized protein LOC144908956 isoform X1 [Branchiostoma floridae x Branchiostoma belcheri]